MAIRQLFFEHKQVTAGIEVRELGHMQMSVPPDSEPLDVLMQATTEWVAKTEAGQRFFQESRGKVNFISMFDAKVFENPGFRKCLAEQHAEVVSVEMVSEEAIFSADLPLVDEKLLLKLRMEPQQDRAAERDIESRADSTPFSFGPG